MRYMKAAEFKAKCLKVMDEVAATGEEVVVTKRGRPVARIGAVPVESPRPIGVGAGARYFIPGDYDLITPIVDPDDWTGDIDNLFPRDLVEPDANAVEAID